MKDVEPFGLVTFVVALAMLAALASSRISERLGVPAPVVFLVAAAAASNAWTSLGSLSIKTDQRIVTVALVVILFDGGMHIGWRRLRPNVGAVVWLGIAGTVVTAGAMSVAAHVLFGFGWRSALLVGTALAPTDPAVVFSVLGRREISGRTGTLLEGESGANDPVGIALMISILGAGSGGGAVLRGVGEFALQMALGLIIGVVGGILLRWVVQRVRLPSAALYPVQTVALALLVYGGATVARGSGFLAVFVAGIVLGDVRWPHRRQVRQFTAALSSVSEIVAFVVLGLSVSLHDVFGDGRVWTGLALAALLVLVARPLFVGLVLLPVRLNRGERVFVLWSGLKGAVPILLGTYVVAQGAANAGRIYDLIFIVVTASVIVQGGLVPIVARRCGVPMRVIDGSGPT
ncbi:MAG TPA: cation:proton antiporter [Jatrophihabitantaceae bacterium]|nr:cation:proton antiporter [Jatrophihabitantaceae bacterium]